MSPAFPSPPPLGLPAASEPSGHEARGLPGGEGTLFHVFSVSCFLPCPDSGPGFVFGAELA